MSLVSENAALIAILNEKGLAEGADRFVRQLREELISEGGHLLELLPRPVFCEPDEVAKEGGRGHELIDIQTRLIVEALESKGRGAFLDHFSVEGHDRNLVNWDELVRPTYLIARLDLLRVGRGFKCCEINVDSCVAGAEIFDTAREALSTLGLPDDALPPRPLDQLARLIARKAREREAKRIVILDWSVGGGSGGKGYLNYDRMQNAIARASNLPVHVADDQTYAAEWIAAPEASQTFVHRGFMMEEIHDGGAFLSKLQSAGTHVLSTYEADIRMDKGWFALFWDAVRQGRLSPAEADLIRDFTPETWQVDADNLAALVERKDGLIFKTRRSFGGAGILVGSEVSGSALRSAISETGASAWIAQDMLRAERFDMPHVPGGGVVPHEVVYGLYLYGTDANGLLVRGSTCSRVVNVTAGKARLSWALAVKQEDRAAFLRHLEMQL